jgi:competence protein ComEC
MDRVELIKVIHKKTLIENLDYLFYFCRTQIRKYVPFPASSLVAGVLLGDQSGFSKDMQNEFRSAGLSHVIVLSGFNVTLVANSVYSLFKKRGKKVALLSALSCLFIFLLFVGPTLALMRAALMTTSTLFVRFYNLGNHMMRALLLAALVIGFINPYTLLYDISFHLSFLATFGLIAFGNMFSKLIETRFSWIPEKFELRETLSSTFAAQLGVLPIMIFQMGSVPLISPFINLLVVPLIPYLMILGALVILTCWLPLAAWIFGITAWLISSFVFFIAHLSLWGPIASFVVRK